jgi:hypothetical protein
VLLPVVNEQFLLQFLEVLQSRLVIEELDSRVPGGN